MDEGALAARLSRHLSAHGVPGAAIGVLRNGEAVAAYCGVADVRRATAVTAATRFAIGSLTKSMVACALVVLDAERLLRLDDRVAALVPELAQCRWAGGATVRDLLANRSSVPLLAALEFGFDQHPGGDDGALTRLVTELAGEPPAGGHWSYANVGWCVLGRTIETVTGLPWEEAMPAVLERVGLRATSWTTSPLVDRAVGYDTSGVEPVPMEPLLSRAYSPAGATVASTLEDLLRFAAWQLSDPVARALRTVHAAVRINGWFDAWCLGLGRFDWPGAPAWGWDGMVSGQRSVLRLVPDRDGAVVVLANGSRGRALARSVLAEVVPECFEVDVAPDRARPSATAPAGLAPYVGDFGWPDRRIEVREAHGGLRITEDGVTREAVPLDRETFLLDRDDPDGATATFGDFDAAGRPAVLYDLVWGLGRLPHP